jgi:hypothetical protein
MPSWSRSANRSDAVHPDGRVSLHQISKLRTLSTISSENPAVPAKPPPGKRVPFQTIHSVPSVSLSMCQIRSRYFAGANSRMPLGGSRM